MSEAWVVNASPLILFSRIGRLDLIERLASTILVPNAVIDEVRAGQGKDLTAAVALRWAAQHRIDDATVPASVEHWDLGAGESQVIAHCVGASRWAVLDDRAARRCAAIHGVTVIGSLGVVLRSKKKGHVVRARPLIDDLIAAGMFVEVRSPNRRPPTPVQTQLHGTLSSSTRRVVL